MPQSVLISGEPDSVAYFSYGRPGSQPVGVALGTTSGCRLSIRERHLHFNALPAFTAAVDTTSAMDALRAYLAKDVFAEVIFGSFDAVFLPRDGVRPRLEYVVPLQAGADPLQSVNPNFQRRVRKADREGWTLRFLTGQAAGRTLLEAHASTAERADSRARGFEPVSSSRWEHILSADARFPFAGLAVLAAFADDELLSAILIGWAASRAYYLVGGSTPPGFKRSSAAWLQVMAMRRLAAEGMTSYNLGGTPMHAMEETSAANGLYRFKASLGALITECRGLEWRLGTIHLGLHTVVNRLKRAT